MPKQTKSGAYYYLRPETKKVLDLTWDICELERSKKEGYLRYIKLDELVIRLWPEGLFLGCEWLIKDKLVLSAGRSILSGAWYLGKGESEPPAEQMGELATSLGTYKKQIERTHTKRNPVSEIQIIGPTFDKKAMKNSKIKIGSGKGAVEFTYLWGKQ